jgi:hypothetical protein
VVKRAAGPHILAFALEANKVANHLHNIGVVNDLIY